MAAGMARCRLVRCAACIAGAATVALGMGACVLAQPSKSDSGSEPPAHQISLGAIPVATPAPDLTPEELGDLAMARRKYQAALEAYHQSAPITAAIWNKIGIANQQMYVTAEAKRSYEISLKKDPKNPDVMNNLGTVYYSLKDYRSAERLYRKALKLNSTSALIYKNLGTALLAEGKFEKGSECYRQALTIDSEVFARNNQLRIGEPAPKQSRGAVSYYLAKSYARTGMTDRAVDSLRMAINQGFADRRKILADKEFASLRGVPAFEQLLSERRM